MKTQDKSVQSRNARPRRAAWAMLALVVYALVGGLTHHHPVAAPAGSSSIQWSAADSSATDEAGSSAHTQCALCRLQNTFNDKTRASTVEVESTPKAEILFIKLHEPHSEGVSLVLSSRGPPRA
ncbi:MAG TPA: hypothetical protein VG778_03765 [Blastocatellia bacterium]|nr:hypothetical protein [Blastocatellia bacterium]